MTKNLVPVTVPHVTFYATKKYSWWSETQPLDMIVPGEGFYFWLTKNLSSILLLTVTSVN